MKRAHLSWLPQATKDLMTLPRKVQEEILRKVDFLENFPLIGPSMFGAFQGYRSLLAGHYLIIYKVKSVKKVEISRVLHGSRQRYLRLIPGGRG